MKKLVAFLFSVTFAITGFAQSMKMVVNAQGQPVGRYVKTNANTYTVEAQDDFEVSKRDHKVVVYSAEAGQGSVMPKNPGSINVRSTPSTQGAIVGKITYELGDMPEDYPCKGKVNGWYKISINNKIGYVRADLVEWSGMSFGDSDIVDEGVDDSYETRLKGYIANAPVIITMRDDEMVEFDGNGMGYSGTLTFTSTGETSLLEGYFSRGHWFFNCKNNAGKTTGRLELGGDYTGEYRNLTTGKTYNVKFQEAN